MCPQVFDAVARREDRHLGRAVASLHVRRVATLQPRHHPLASTFADRSAGAPLNSDDVLVVPAIGRLHPSGNNLMSHFLLHFNYPRSLFRRSGRQQDF